MNTYQRPLRSDELAHFGTKGMHWGVRRYQNEDGTLTPAGKERYYKLSGDSRYGRNLRKMQKERDRSVADAFYNYHTAQDIKTYKLDRGKNTEKWQKKYDQRMSNYKNYSKTSSHIEKAINKSISNAMKQNYSVVIKDRERFVQSGEQRAATLLTTGMAAVALAAIPATMPAVIFIPRHGYKVNSHSYKVKKEK